MGAETAPFLLNERRRSVKCPGVFGARVSAATIRKEPTGIGDSIMADLRNGFFGVADSSDRNPAFGLAFMDLFSAFLSTVEFPSEELVYEEQSIEFLRKTVLVGSETLLGTLPIRGSCAFTGLRLVRTQQGLAAMVFHSGIRCFSRLVLPAKCVSLRRAIFGLWGSRRASFRRHF